MPSSFVCGDIPIFGIHYQKYLCKKIDIFEPKNNKNKQKIAVKTKILDAFRSMFGMNENFYKSARWKKIRESVLRRDMYKCQYSKGFGKNVPATMVHHIFPLEDYPQYALSPWNLISLSNAAHEKMHDKLHGGLSKAGKELMKRTALKHNIDILKQEKPRP